MRSEQCAPPPLPVHERRGPLTIASPGQKMCEMTVPEPCSPNQPRLHRVVGGEVPEVDQGGPLHVRHAALPQAPHAALTDYLTECVRRVLHSENGRSGEVWFESIAAS